MEERGLKHKDIWPVLGNKGTAAEVLAGRRSISKAQAKRLAEFLRVPVETVCLEWLVKIVPPLGALVFWE